MLWKFSKNGSKMAQNHTEEHNTLFKSDITCHDHVSVAMDAGSHIVNFIRDGTVFA